MKPLPFKKSAQLSIGIELEFQIIDPLSFCLVSRAKDLIRNIQESPCQDRITAEITQGMIEINSSVHHSIKEMYDELIYLQDLLINKGRLLNVVFCGGGTHPFQTWSTQKIFPSKRYKNILQKYKYLSKRATVFGQHIHVGCTSADDALYLTHALARYVPQFIAISASSPFYQGMDTGYYSSRSSVFNAFPLSGVIPYLINWDEFSNYFYKMHHYGIIESMKDFYWDLRPKPEFGTVEIRVCDTPLTLKKAMVITAYIQALSFYLLQEKPLKICHDLYFLYASNRFQASRYGFDGDFINPYTGKHCLIAQDILATIKKIEKYINKLDYRDYIAELADDVINKRNDTAILRQIHKQTDNFSQIVAEQCKAWSRHE